MIVCVNDIYLDKEIMCCTCLTTFLNINLFKKVVKHVQHIISLSR